MYYEEQGAGAPVVLVHGLGGSTAMWQLVAGPLAERFRVVAYDLRGLGRSSTPRPPYSVDLLAADLGGLLDALELERATLVGHSLGGTVALTYATVHPERVSSVVAVSAPSFTSPELRSGLAERGELARRDGMAAVAELHAQAGLPEDFRTANPDVTAVYKQILGSGDPLGYAALCGVAVDLDAERLGQLTMPVLLVEGELDRVVPPATVRATAAAITGCRYVELEGCGHIVPLERPDELVALIGEFVYEGLAKRGLGRRVVP